MLIITRYRHPQRQRRQYTQRRQKGQGIASSIMGHVINTVASKVTAQKIAEAIADGSAKLITKAANKGSQLAAEAIAKRYKNTKAKKKNKNSSPRIDTLGALINGSGILYD
ncbi:MAG: hypothetical protein ABGX53_06910 [Candidatus Thioglobus sp.]